MKSLKEIDLQYNLELNKIASEIKKKKAKIVLLQFPEGIKPYATAIVNALEKKTHAELLIWLGSCFGACDFPLGLEKIRPKIDLIIQFGHNEKMPTCCK